MTNVDPHLVLAPETAAAEQTVLVSVEGKGAHALTDGVLSRLQQFDGKRSISCCPRFGAIRALAIANRLVRISCPWWDLLDRFG